MNLEALKSAHDAVELSNAIETKLQVLKDFQDKHPTSHVGGSIGLLIHGVNLYRDLTKSDLDITIDEYEFTVENQDGLDATFDNNDFDFCLKKILPDGHYVKIDVRVCPEPSFEILSFNGVAYNVSTLRNILYWKRVYANKGSEKHELDLYAINTGIRKEISKPQYSRDSADDLPF